MSSSSFIYRQRSSAQGFTLVELLATVTILAILLAVGVPNLTQMLQDKAAASCAAAFASDLRLARTEAIKRGVPIELCGVSIATTTNNQIIYSCLPATVTDWTANGWMVPNPNDAAHPIKVQAIPTGAGKFQVALGSGSYSLRFNPTGILSIGGGFGTATISPPNNAVSVRRVVVSNTGRTRVTKGNQS